MKDFDAYIMFIESYGGRNPIYTSIVKSKIAETVIQDTNNPTLE